ncbi:MAG: metallophosphoesterase [Dethiobacteria bacterium]|jgi:predicted MPP superfamily phosphohydrolase|nr:metallophosphoesterase [Bacillota bacterium]
MIEKKILITLIIIIIIFSLVIFIYHSTNSLTVKHYTIPVKNLPPHFEGFTILHLSDLHNKRFGKNQARLLALIKEQEFDVTALTGDLLDSRNPDIEPIRELLTGLKESDIYYVFGNHDHRLGDDILKLLLKDYGVNILENEATRFRKDNEHIWLLGVEDPSLGLARLDIALAEVNDNAPKILLAHAPNIFPPAVKDNIDLILVGHTHGGQIRAPFLGALYVPGQGFAPEYDYGKFSSANTTMIVNAGLGESVIPLRFNMRPEIVLVTLVAQ